jgi:hypothetical protein
MDSIRQIRCKTKKILTRGDKIRLPLYHNFQAPLYALRNQKTFPQNTDPSGEQLPQ